MNKSLRMLMVGAALLALFGGVGCNKLRARDQLNKGVGSYKNAKYEETLKKIDADARKALDAIKGQVPEAAALLAQPTDDNARKLVAAIAGKDLTPQVGKLLPPKNTYK